MKVVILAGGYGTRISEESESKPKPMINVGNKPLLWHVMRNFYRFGYDEFIICTGYKGYMINNYFSEYANGNSDMSYDFRDGTKSVINSRVEKWKVSVIDTGIQTMTGGRLKRIKDFIGDESFFLTYGDGVSDVDINKLLEFHNKEKNMVTLTAVQPSGRFGVLDISADSKVKRFAEKAKADVDWINGGFMVMQPGIFDYIDGDSTILERDPLECLAKENKLGAYLHRGYWHCVDTMKDKNDLEQYLKDQTPVWM